MLVEWLSVLLGNQWRPFVFPSELCNCIFDPVCRAISVLLGDEWKKLTPEEKKKFKDKSELLAKEQKILHPDCWKRKK